MGVAIKCILEQGIAGLPFMEGKSLATAYCGERGVEVPEEERAADIIEIDFSGSGRKGGQSASPQGDFLLSPLKPFISSNGVEWHFPGEGLAAVRSILARLREGARVELDPEFPFREDDDDDLTDGVQCDLEELETILVAAEKN